MPASTTPPSSVKTGMTDKTMFLVLVPPYLNFLFYVKELKLSKPQKQGIKVATHNIQFKPTFRIRNNQSFFGNFSVLSDCGKLLLQGKICPQRPTVEKTPCSVRTVDLQLLPASSLAAAGLLLLRRYVQVVRVAVDPWNRRPAGF